MNSKTSNNIPNFEDLVNYLNYKIEQIKKMKIEV